MADNPHQSSLSGLARALVQAGRLKEAEAEVLLTQAAASKTSFIEQVVNANKATAPDIARFASETFGFPLFDIASYDDAHMPQGAIDRKLIAQHRVIPLYKRGNRLAVAIADPTHLRALDEIRFQTGMAVDPVIVSESQLSPLVTKLSETAEEALKQLASEDINLEFGEGEPGEKGDDAAAQEVEDAPVVKFIQKMLLDAINDGASDIHFEPYEKSYRIRFRVDGILREIASPPLVIKEKIASRIKVISRLNIAEKRVPQDGRMRLVLSKSRAIDFRVSTLPTMYGEKIVLRILDPSSATLGIDALGYEPEQKALLLDAISRPYGMVLVTGPTGSGKTVSLYTALGILNDDTRNISTVEDPVEIRLPGVNQVQQNVKRGMTFAAALRSFLRQDPDVIMVGEIRDLETAEIAVKAAQTGHMVLSTLHTNDAPQTIARLMNMGIAPYNITSSVSLVIAQRLVRRLHDCKRAAHLPEHALLAEGFTADEVHAGITVFEAVGCEDCTEGYKGRAGIYQVMPMNDEIQQMVLAGGNVQQITEASLRSGVRDLRRSALDKVKQGITSLIEINRVTKD